MAIKEHPWGREMLSQLIGAGFKPALIIEEDSEVGETERKKFEFRIGNNEIGQMISIQAKENNIPLETVPIHNDEHCMKHIERVSPRMIVFGGTRIIRGEILEYGEKRDGVLNSHPGLLPECRGSASPAWSIYHDIPIGSSCHFCSSEIDAGDLVGKRKIDIKRDKPKYWAVLTVNTRPRCSFRIQSLMMNNQYFSLIINLLKIKYFSLIINLFKN